MSPCSSTFGSHSGEWEAATSQDMRERFSLLEEDHMIQRVLCTDLENVADRLPQIAPLPELRRLCSRIRLVSGHYERAEASLAWPSGEGHLEQQAICRLRSMHQLDELHGEDLIAALWNFVEDRADVGQLAYMLRCFFDGCRRAIALKESMMATILAGRVSPD